MTQCIVKECTEEGTHLFRFQIPMPRRSVDKNPQFTKHVALFCDAHFAKATTEAQLGISLKPYVSGIPQEASDR